MVMFILTWVSVDLLMVLLLFFIQYGLGLGEQSEIVMGPIFVTALLALPLWLLVAQKLDKRKAFIIGLAFWAVVQIVLILLTPASPLGIVLAVCVLAGIGVSAAHVLPWSIIPDAVEWDEWKTGTRHEGVFFSIVTLGQKVASSLAVPGALLVLEWSGWESGASVQSEGAMRALRILVGPVPAAFLVAAIIAAIFYPLGREEYKKIVAELEARRSKDRPSSQASADPS